MIELNSHTLRRLIDSFIINNPTPVSILNAISFLALVHHASPVEIDLKVPDLLCQLWEIKFPDGRTQYAIELWTGEVNS